MKKIYTTNEYRKNIPHKMPFLLQLAVSNVCNLKCEYCTTTSSNFVHADPFMSYDTFCSIIDNISRSVEITGERIMNIMLIGAGEPLLNRRIADMVRYIKTKKVCRLVSITTNGISLTEKLSDELIDAGVDVIRFSLNGLSDEDYLQYTGVKVDYHKLNNQIEYLHSHRKNTLIYTKIFHYMVSDEKKKQQFLHEWSGCSDIVHIENVTELPFDGISYDSFRDGYENINLQGNKIADIGFCTYPFILCSVSETGLVAACCTAQLISGSCPKELLIGDTSRNLIHEIWNGEKMNRLRLSLLRGTPQGICSKCNSFKQCFDEDESLESEKDRLITLLDKAL